MKYWSTPKLECGLELSDGTVIKRESFEAIVDHIKGKIAGLNNVAAHYQKEIDQAQKWAKALQEDLDMFLKDNNG